MTDDKPSQKMGGPRGAVFFTLFMTSYTYYITIKVQTGDWGIFSLPAPSVNVTDVFNIHVTVLVVIWFLAQCAMYRIQIGGKVELGVKLENGQQLEYTANAFFVLHVNMAVAYIVLGDRLATVSRWSIHILTASVLLCVILSVILYLKESDVAGKNKHGNTGIGYYIYRASNSEKNNFRKNPKDPRLSHLKTMPTSAGKKLLITGWWGMCRHPNYLGDLMMSASYALSTGTGYVIPYLGTIILVLLLLDRGKQDNQDCERKYGKDWDKYCTIVKYRIVPWIY